MADDAKVNIGVNASKAYQELDKLLTEAKKVKRDIEKTPAAEVGIKFNTAKNKAQLLRQAEDLIKSIQNKMTANPVAWQVKSKVEATAAQEKANADAAKAAAAAKIAADKAAAAEAKKLAAEKAAAEKAAAAAAVKSAKEKEAAEKQLNSALNALGKKREGEFVAQTRRELAAQKAAYQEQIAAFQKLQDSTHRINSSELPRMRYALYDVANAAQNVSSAVGGMLTTVVSTAASFETSFTAVERTTGATGTQLEGLRTGLLDLASEIPVTFQDLSGIASLGAQLGIASENVVSFTDTISKFSAVTNVSTEQAAQSFGALAQLLGVGASEFDNFGSAVAEAGVKSVATESEILSVATQIGGVAANAKLSAQTVIGLSTTLASLRVPAEQSRGALTRIFQEANRAAAEGGKSLDAYAAALGMTSAATKDLIANDMSGFLTQFIDSMSTKSTLELTSALDSLGLADVRVFNTVSRLAENNELLAKTQDIVNQSYQEGTFLNEAFGTKVDDLSSKFTILTSVFQEIAAAAGGAASGPLKDLLDLVIDFGKSLRDFVSTETGQFISALVIGFSALAGAVAVGVGLFATFIAGTFALRTAVEGFAKSGQFASNASFQFAASLFKINLEASGAAQKVIYLSAADAELAAQARIATTANIGLGNSLTQNTQRAWANFAAQSALQKVMAVTSWVGIAVAAISLISVAWDSIANSAENAKKKSEEYFGDTQGLVDAFKADAASGAEPIQNIGTEIEATNVKAKGWVKSLEDASGAQVALNENTSTSTDAIVKQTMAYGEATKAALANSIANNENFQNLFKSGQGFSAINAAGFNANPETFVQSILGDPEKGGQKYIDNLILGMTKQTGVAQGQIQALFSSFAAARDAGLLGSAGADTAAAGLAAQMGITFDAAKQLLEGLYQLKTASDSVTVATSSAATVAAAYDTVLEAQGQTTANVAEDVKALNDAITAFVDEQFAAINASSKTQSALTDLGDTLASSGDAAALYGGQLQGAIAAMAAEDPTNLRGKLQYLLEYIMATFPTATGTIAQLQKVIAGLSGSKTAIPFDVSAFTRGMNKVKTSAGGASKAVRTLLDYAGDLQKVFKRAFDIRFGSQDALDSVTSSFNSMRKSMEDARKSLRDLNTDIQGLSADKALKEYFLTIAVAYGDTIRADELRAELAQINNEIADAQQELSNTQAQATPTLVGNSQAAIDNRSEIRGIVQGYAEYISSLAAAGASQDTLAAATAQARADFLSQASALGYADSELQAYLTTFEDMTTTIGAVAPNVTVAFDTNPALQALNELAAAASKTASGITNDFGDIDTSIPTEPAANSFYTIEERELRGFKNRVNADKNGIDWKTALGFDKLQTYPSQYLSKPFETGYTQVLSGARIAKQGVDTEFRAIGTSGTTQSDVVKNSWSNAASSIPGSIAAQKATAAANASSVGAGAAGGLNSGLSANANIAGIVSSKVGEAQNPASVNASSVGSAIGTVMKAGISVALNNLLGTNSASRKFIRSLTGFSDGGYTGAGGKNEVAGIVHRGEYVVPKSEVNQTTGMPYYMQQTPQYFSGGGNSTAAQSGGMVSLSPEDRALLRNVGGSGNIVLYADGKELARTVNDGNRQIVAQGGRP